jgi:hypothetical protein
MPWLGLAECSFFCSSESQNTSKLQAQTLGKTMLVEEVPSHCFFSTACHAKQENPEDSSIEFDHLGAVPIHEAHDCLDYCGRPCACPPTRMQASTPKHFMQPEEPDETGMADESTGQTRQSSYAKLI